MDITAQGLVRDAARWLFLAALIYAPWAYGCTTPDTIRILNRVLALVLVLALSALLLRICRRRASRSGNSSRPPRILSLPPLAALAGLALVLFGWWMTWNARSVYDPDFFVFIPCRPWLEAGPGSVDAAISSASMIRVTLLLGVLFFVSKLAQDRVWLLRLWWTLAAVGASIALLGLLQKATGAEASFWKQSGNWQPASFFATYYYHGNAGAYLNLVLPPAATLVLRGFQRKTAPHVRALAVVLCLLVVAGALANTSRMGQVLTAALLLALGLYFRRITSSQEQRTSLSNALLVAGVLGLAVIAILSTSHLDQSLGRWRELTSTVMHDARWMASRAALASVGPAGVFGFGPGTFRVVFPYFSQIGGQSLEGVWRFLHEDYLQTLNEWGWLGSALWAILFFGGIIVALAHWRRETNWRPRQRLFLLAMILALLATALHALVDFPLQIASLQLYVATYLGVCWGSVQWSENKQARSR